MPALNRDRGRAHTCALDANGDVRCWGDNSSGQLGIGSVEDVGDDDVPLDAVPLDGDAVAIAAGGDHTCAILVSGRLQCWGAGADGRLGSGGTANVGDQGGELPVVVVDIDSDNDATVTRVACGARHTCALLSTGVLRCFGDGSTGALGNGATANVGDRGPPVDGPAVTFDPAIAVKAIAAGDGFSCAILIDESVRCWGIATVGQTGLGATPTTSRPGAALHLFP